jgi:hypothetical protein
MIVVCGIGVCLYICKTRSSLECYSDFFGRQNVKTCTPSMQPFKLSKVSIHMLHALKEAGVVLRNIVHPLQRFATYGLWLQRVSCVAAVPVRYWLFCYISWRRRRVITSVSASSCICFVNYSRLRCVYSLYSDLPCYDLRLLDVFAVWLLVWYCLFVMSPGSYVLSAAFPLILSERALLYRVFFFSITYILKYKTF